MVLDEIATKPVTDQKEILTQSLNSHQGTTIQRDDITIVGIKM